MSEATVLSQAVEQSGKQTKDWAPAKVIYTGLMVFNLLSFLWLLATGSGIGMPLVIWITRVAAALLAIYLGKLWKDRGFQILSAYTLLFFFRVFISHPENTFNAEMAESIFSALWLFAGCYGLGRILDGKTLKKLLKTTATIWTIGIVIYSAFGIYAAWTDRIINSLGQGTFQLIGDVWYRLQLIYLPTAAGSILSVSALIALIMAIGKKKKVWKAFFFLAALIIIITLALTDSRSAYLSVSAGMAVITFALVRNYFQKKLQNKPVQWIRWTITIIAVLITFAIVFFLLMRVIPSFNNLKIKGLVPAAYAEEADNAGKSLAQRGFHTVDIFSGRIELWESIWRHLTGSLKILLFGESKVGPLLSIGSDYAHCHCLYIQILLESGLIGILLIIAFIFYVLIYSFKAIEQKSNPVWVKLLPAVCLSLLAGDTVECFMWLRSSQCPMNAVFFIAAGMLYFRTDHNKAVKDPERNQYDKGDVLP